MALNPRNGSFAQTAGRVGDRADIDAGLRSYMLSVYNYMALGVALTGMVAMVVAMNPAVMQAVALGPMKWVLFIGVLGLGWFSGKIMFSGSPAMAQGAFWLYAGLWGVLIAPMFYVYTGESIVRVFFITSAAFAGTSLYGYTTKKDLTAMGRFLIMAAIGCFVAMIVNIFMESAMFHFILSIVVVLVFAGLTAYETQTIKNAYYGGDSGDLQNRKAIFGAFILYGSFITMFIWLLALFGNRE